MIVNPQRILGGMLRGTLFGGLPMSGDAALGIGLLGVAIAAYEHYAQQRAAGQPAGPPTPPASVPPPAPAAAPAPAPPAPAPRVDTAHHDALLLIRAMITAASADGVIDGAERGRILGREGVAALSEEERTFLARELATPSPVDALVAEVASRDLAEQFYLVSLLAISLDSNANRVYVKELAAKLALDAATLARLHTLAGVPQP